jgi:hypothetical protein
MTKLGFLSVPDAVTGLFCPGTAKKLTNENQSSGMPKRSFHYHPIIMGGIPIDFDILSNVRTLLSNCPNHGISMSLSVFV